MVNNIQLFRLKETYVSPRLVNSILETNNKIGDCEICIYIYFLFLVIYKLKIILLSNKCLNRTNRNLLKVFFYFFFNISSSSSNEH